ncbi:Extracellular matrix-binding ebh, putative [Babesia ovata]|uniref:Extracellular matrix-binding ebh, putative n=1 Tax=Babesia ovata TaxID=189622 RepID=A0A2H6KHN7_9APIC|nr:Extracellular matrix-binding ebh, putative [Babesia ovata]GBE62504.1 Extracellular matrix-binding ebh, putative [Babesia ovata]
MDSDLKMDLRKVKTAIQAGFKEVIDRSEVLKLGERVKEDLEKLKRKIENLSTNVETSEAGSGLIGTQLQTLASKKTDLDNGAVKRIQTAEQGLEGKFKTEIQQPLSQAVEKVDQAIRELGGKFDPQQGERNIEKIFGYIKTKVGEIKGSERDQKGLDGIVAKVKALANAFVNSGGNGFKLRVDGWLEGIIGNGKKQGETNSKPGLAAVNSWFQQYKEVVTKKRYKENDLTDQVKNKIVQQTEISKAIAAAQLKFNDVRGRNDQSKITGNLKAIVDACEEFVEELDKELTNGKIDNLANPIARKIRSWMNGQSLWNGVTDVDLKCAVRYSLVALCASVRQVGNEINSLGTDKFGEILDTIKPVVDGLYSNLEQATNNFPSNQDGTAKAVDSKLQAVRDEVSQLDSKFSQVKHDLEEAVKELPDAVDSFNGAAEHQIKEAAKMAIQKAANEITRDSDPKKIELSQKMQTFHGQFTAITHNKTGLQPQLEGLLEKHIGTHVDQAGVPLFHVANTFILSKLFDKYGKHVRQDKISALTPGKTLKGEATEGLLPLAIGNIKTQVFDVALPMIDPQAKGGTATINEDTFTGPFSTIKGELEEIKKLVENKTQQQPPGQDHDGVKDLLEKLRKGLGKEKLEKADKGLQEIYDEINKLQTGKFDSEPKAIDTAVKAIRQQLKDLRDKLQKNNGEDVILTLTELQSKGLEKQDWQNGKGQPLSGLGKIHGDLQAELNTLKYQPVKINDAIKAVREELILIGIKLNHEKIHDDVTDRLKELESKIGKGMGIGLEMIAKKINKLQNGPFKQDPQTIDEAKEAIKKELIALQGELHGTPGREDVIETLNDLMNKGLGRYALWTPNYKDAKGLKNIQKDLKISQAVLTKQPERIGGGVQSITSELERLQKQLSDDVTDKLRKLKESGLNHDKKTWTDKGNNINGLVKIKNQLEKLKNGVFQNLNTKIENLRKAIRDSAGDVRVLLTKQRKVPSFHHVDYFDDGPLEVLDVI